MTVGEGTVHLLRNFELKSRGPAIYIAAQKAACKADWLGIAIDMLLQGSSNPLEGLLASLLLLFASGHLDSHHNHPNALQQ